MAISPFEINTSISRTQDFAAMKHAEANKATSEQGTFVNQMAKEVSQKMGQVQESEKSDTRSENSDSYKRGKNSYQGDGGQNRKKDAKPVDGVVISKKPSNFDISI